MANENELMQFPDDAKILRDPNEWIENTAATFDVTVIKTGMDNSETQTGSSVVVSYNDEYEQPE